MSEKTSVSPDKKSKTKSKNRVSNTQKSDSPQFIGLSVDRILFIQRTIGDNAFGRLFKSRVLQAELRIEQPGDEYEEEAGHTTAQCVSTTLCRAGVLPARIIKNGMFGITMRQWSLTRN